jgi:hypothetical protein
MRSSFATLSRLTGASDRGRPYLDAQQGQTYWGTGITTHLALRVRDISIGEYFVPATWPENDGPPETLEAPLWLSDEEVANAIQLRREQAQLVRSAPHATMQFNQLAAQAQCEFRNLAINILQTHL